MALTPKQSRFVEEYLIDLNATQAAIRAGYSVKTAKSIGQRLLTFVDVQKAIQGAQKKLSERTKITQERVLQEYARIAFLDPRKLFDEHGELLPITSLDAEVAAAIGGLDVVISRTGDKSTTEETKKIKLIDKKGALDSIAKHLGMFTDKVEVTGANGAPVQVATMTFKEYEERARRLLDEV